MGWFRRSDNVAASASGCTATAAAVGSVAWFAQNSAVGVGRARAMALPTISRARDVLASIVASCPIKQYGTQWNGEDLELLPLPPDAWMLRPDPSTTRSHTLAWTFDDLMFYGRAHWFVSSRYPSGYPASFTWLPAEYVTVTAALTVGNQPVGDYTIRFQGTEIPNRDVVNFWSPLEPALRVGVRTICTAERLENAAMRLATNPVGFGWLKVTSGEPMSAEELAELGTGWVDARTAIDGNSVGVLSADVDYIESNLDPSRLQLMEGRAQAALDLARVANVPPWIVGISIGGMTYSNVQEQNRQAVLYGALPFLEVIEQTLSSDQVLPPGRVVRLDRSAWLEAVAEMPAEIPNDQPQGVTR